MTSVDESILKSALRTFFKVIFALLGVCVGLIPLLLFLGLLADGTVEELPQKTSITVMEDAAGMRAPLRDKGPVLLRLDINGFIGSEVLNGDSVATILEESREGRLSDNRVAGILLVLDTPGGTVIDADRIYRALMLYKKRHDVPILAYVDGICFSGGMYISSAADAVITSDTSIVGSIGVVQGPFFNFSDAMSKLGVQALTVSAGNSKDTLNPTRPWLPGEAKDLEVAAHALYDRFIDIVTKARQRVDRERLINEFGARIFPAATGVEYGLVDATGATLGDAIMLLAQQAQVADKDYQVVRLEQRPWLGQFFMGKSPLFSGRVRHEIALPGGLDARVSSHLFYYHYPLMQ